MQENPHALGYSMPAEWEPHRGTWLSWPKNPLTFSPELLPRVEAIYAELIRELATGEEVYVLVDDAGTKSRVQGLLAGEEKAKVQILKTVDVWTRDYAPIFIRNSKNKGYSQIAATKWHFNAWGNKYEDLLADNANGSQLALASGVQVFSPQMVLEGGSIDVNGAGTGLTTTQCLLNKNRNPQLSPKQIEAMLQNYLGITHLIWLNSGIAGDDTDGHVDDIARFVDEATVVCMNEENAAAANFAPLQENLRLLQQAADQVGRKLRVLPMAMPKKKLSFEDAPLPASYANFYIGNKVVLVPVFDDVNDDAALTLLRKQFPSRRVVGIDCAPLIHGFGGIHCVTQQLPA